MKRFPVLFAFALLALSVSRLPALELFDEREAWSWAKREHEAGTIFRVLWRSSGGPAGGPFVQVRSSAPGWDTTLQRTLLIPPGEGRELRIRGRARAENIAPGAESFMAGRVQLSFLDEHGEMVGGWPGGDLLVGTRDWHEISQTHRPPTGAAAVTIMLGLVNATGRVDYADFTLEARDSAGRELALVTPPDSLRTDTSGWHVFPGPGEDRARPLAIDLGAILGGEEAGARGHVVARGGELFFADGTPARFWGTNIGPPSTWNDADAAALQAERLAREGFNLVRLHHLDRGWAPNNLFVDGADETQGFDAARLDRLHRFTAELRKRGVYLALDLLVTRRFRPGDEVRDAEALEHGAKMVAHFDERILRLQEDYARRLLATRNPYTGLTYAEDPAVVFVSIINESSLFMKGAISSWAKVPPSYLDDLRARFAAWRAERGLPPAAAASGAAPAADIAALFNRRDPDLWRFLRETQDAGFDRMASFLREELGVRALIAGSNFIETATDLASNARLDYVDAHSYWDHPIGGWSVTDGQSNRSVIPSLARDNPFRGIAALNALARPLAISEWQACWANEYLAEFPPLMAAIAGQQGWDAPMWFGHAGGDYEDTMRGVFTNDNKPHARLAAAFAALAFRRGDFGPLPARVFRHDGAEPWESPGTLLAGGRLLEERLLWSADPQATADQAAPAAADPGAVRRVGPPAAVLESARTRAVLGRFDGEVEARGLRVESRTPFVVIGLSSLDGAPVERSRRLLLLALARMENTGQVFRAFRKGLSDAGGPPILHEPVRATIKIPRDAEAGELSLTPLDHYGRRVGETRRVERAADGSARLVLDGPAWLWAELSVAP